MSVSGFVRELPERGRIRRKFTGSGRERVSESPNKMQYENEDVPASSFFYAWFFVRNHVVCHKFVLSITFRRQITGFLILCKKEMVRMIDNR